MPNSESQPAIDAEWRAWIAENVLLGKAPPTIIEAMVRDGFPPDVAGREVQAALAHPYLRAARKLRTPAAGREDLLPKLKKRDWVLEVYRHSARQASTFGQVPRVQRPSRQQLLDEYYAPNRPVVIEGAMDDWPALTRWTGPRLQERFGDRIVEVQANRESDPNYELNQANLRREMPFGELIELIETAETNDYYITANNSGRNKEALRELWDDIVVFPEYLREEALAGFFWFGPRGTVTPLHHDLTNNFMAQVRGRKRVRLIAPYELTSVYNDRHCYSAVDLDHVDLDAYPRFREATVIDVVIGPGDLLFLPVGWWHYVRGLDVSITMTFTNFVFDNDFHSFYSTYQNI